VEEELAALLSQAARERAAAWSGVVSQMAWEKRTGAPKIQFLAAFQHAPSEYRHANASDQEQTANDAQQGRSLASEAGMAGASARFGCLPGRQN